jgi:hypothetical protein
MNRIANCLLIGRTVAASPMRTFTYLAAVFLVGCATSNNDGLTFPFDAGQIYASSGGGSVAASSGGQGSMGTPAVGGSAAETGGAPNANGGFVGSEGGSPAPGSGGDASGGQPDLGATGGQPSGGSPAVVPCDAPSKVCQGNCVSPAPSVGCASTDCNPCSAPDHGIAICTNGACDVACLSGYSLASGACVTGSGNPPADGGTSGSCNDNQKDGQETDVDCGGPTCPPCGDGKICDNNSDCQSGSCRTRLLSSTKTCRASN